MSDGNTQHVRRNRMIIDKPAQLAMAFTVTGLTAAGIVVLMASMFVLPVDAYFDRVSGADMRRSLLIIMGAFFALTVIGITLSCVVLSHRFVGPAFVVRRALAAMAEGRYDERLALRSNDYLGDLADAARVLRDELISRDEKLEELQQAVDDGDMEAARDLVATLRKTTPSEPALAGV